MSDESRDSSAPPANLSKTLIDEPAPATAAMPPKKARSRAPAKSSGPKSVRTAAAKSVRVPAAKSVRVPAAKSVRVPAAAKAAKVEEVPKTQAMPKAPEPPAHATPKAPEVKVESAHIHPVAKPVEPLKPQKAEAKPRAKKTAGPASERAPRSKRAPASRRMPASAKAGAPASAPASDLRKTLFSGPDGQDAAFAAARAEVSRRLEREDEISIPPAAMDDDSRDRAIEEAQRVVRGRAGSDDAELAGVAKHHGWKSVTGRIALGITAGLCLLAFVKIGATRAHHASAPPAAAAQAAVEAPAEAVPPPPVAEEPAPPAAPTKSATEEREAARDLLEHGKTAEAIEAASRSVALDATDAEAWLLLGAAQQSAGHWTEAHDAFVSCTKQATTGNVRECGSMLAYNGPR